MSLIIELRKHASSCDACGQFTTANLLREAIDAITRLQNQLPESMPDCTIQFKECEKGHGRLTATNWIDHGCQTCEIENLRNALNLWDLWSRNWDLPFDNDEEWKKDKEWIDKIVKGA